MKKNIIVFVLAGTVGFGFEYGVGSFGANTG